MSTRVRLLPKTALHVELDDHQQKAASGALIAWRENLLRVSAMAKLFARLVVLVVLPTTPMLRVVLDAQLAGETQYKNRQVAMLCHQARMLLRTELLMGAKLVMHAPIVAKRTLVILGTTPKVQAPSSAFPARQESTPSTKRR